jgi:GNAT superfamily N-acetyltransferase
MSEIEFSTVQTEDELKDFIRFPHKVYRDDPYWVPPLMSERLDFLSKDRNPFFQHGRVEYFLARKGGEIVGTIAAISNDRYNEYQKVNVGFFGFFEVIDDPEVARALLQKAEDWVRNAGHASIIGPAMFSTNDEVGLLVDGFDDAPRILMTYNPPRYEGYILDAGYQKAKDLWAYRNDIPDFIKHIPPKLSRVTERVKDRRNLTIRPVNMKHFDAEVERLKPIYNSSWSRNWGFVPFTDGEINQLAANLKMLIDPDLVLMVEYEGELVGFSLTVPDLSQALRLAHPGPKTPELWTMLKLLWHWKVLRNIDWIRVIALGVLPEYRGLGVDAMLYLETAKNAARKGYKWAESSWILEDNAMMNRAIQLMGGEVYKTYRMYEKRL